MKKKDPLNPSKITRLSWVILIVSIACYFLPFTLQGLTLDGDDFKYPGEDFFLNFNKTLSSGWGDHSFLGGGGKGTLNFYYLILNLFPAQVSAILVYILAIGMVFGGCLLFLRSLGLSLIASFFSSWIISFSPIFFSYIRTGHVGKLHAIGFFFLTFALTIKIVQSQKIAWNYVLLNAVALALGCLTYASQTYLYFAGVYLLFILFYLSSQNGKIVALILTKKKQLSALICSGTLALILSGEGTLSQLQAFTGWDFAQAPNQTSHIPTELVEKKSTHQMTERERWLWATQWSLPKLETIDMLLPGVFGFLSNDQDHPYWGKVGQTSDWEKHRQGYRNYSLTSHYLGIFFVCFLLYALFKAPRRIFLFWGITSLVLLFLSYGKFSFVYEWFYSLPNVNKLRNPNKFLLVLHFTLGILAAYGVQHYYLKVKHLVNNPPANSQNREKFFLYLLVLSLAILSLALFLVTIQKNNLLLYFSNFYSSSQAKVIVSNIQNYLMRGMIVFTLANSLLYIIPGLTKKQMPKAVGFLVIFCFLELYQVNEKFLKLTPIPSQKEETDPISKFFIEENKTHPYRIKILGKGQYLQYFLWNLSGKNSISKVDHLALREGVPLVFQIYFGQLAYDLRNYQLANVHYFVSDQPIQHPQLEYVKHQDYPNIKERIFIYKLRSWMQRIYLRSRYETGNEVESIVGRMNQKDFEIDQVAMIHHKIAQNPSYAIQKVEENRGQLKMNSFTPSKYEVEVSVEAPTILVLANHFHPKWNAYDQASGMLLQHFPVNYLYNGYVVFPETKKITLVFQNTKEENIKNWITASNYFILLILIGSTLVKRRKRKEKN